MHAGWGLDPDVVVIGKPIGGGFPVATYGVTDEIATALDPALHGHDADVDCHTDVFAAALAALT